MKQAVKMNRIALPFVATLLQFSPLEAQETTYGTQLFVENCAVCHGTTGSGDGPLAEYLNVTVPDLRMLSFENDGDFPFARVFGSIDGRREVVGHGSRDMPIWGTLFSAEAAPAEDAISHSGEERMRLRIYALIDYLVSIQRQ